MPLTDFTSDSDASNGSDDTSSNNGTGGTGSGNGIIHTGGPGGPGIPNNPPAPSLMAPPDLEDLLVNYNEKFSGSVPAKFRDGLIDQAMSVLISYAKPNALLVGPAGVGKTRIVEDIARRLADDDPSVPRALKGFTIYELEFASISAGAGIVGQVEQRIQAIVDFIKDPANKAILFLDEAHQLFASKLSQPFKPAMARGDFRMIASTTANEARTINDDPAMARRFSRLIVDELSVEQTMEVLQDTRASMSTHYGHKVSVSDAVLDELLTVAEDLMPAHMHRPDRQLTLLDRSMADRIVRQHRMIQDAQAIGDQSLASMLSSMTTYPLLIKQVREVAEKMRRGTATAHRSDVTQLKTALQDALVGQDAVIDQVTDALSRKALSLFKDPRPTSWLFAGSSGTGKTETVRILAEQMTGREPIILNMSEYTHASAETKILGSPPGYIGSDSQREKPFDTLESDPHRVILLDEFEKAHRDIQRLFLSVLDTGTLTDASGTVIDFSKAIVVATTNAGREVSGDRPQIGFAPSAPSALSDESLTKALAEHFDKELLGRFQLRMAFESIDRGLFREICAAHFVRLRAQIAEHNPSAAAGLPVALDDAALDELAQTSFVAALGARPARAAVQRWIEDRLLQAQAAAASSSGQIAVAVQPNDDPDQNGHRG